MEIIKCRKISKGTAKGRAIVSKDPLSFLGGVNPTKGTIIDPKHDLYQENVKDQILVIPSGKGSTVGSYVIFQMKKSQTAPKGIIALEAEPIIATGAIMAGIPMVDMPGDDFLEKVVSGDEIEINADEEIIIIKKNE